MCWNIRWRMLTQSGFRSSEEAWSSGNRNVGGLWPAVGKCVEECENSEGREGSGVLVLLLRRRRRRRRRRTVQN